MPPRIVNEAETSRASNGASTHAAQDINEQLTALKDDVAKLTHTLSDLVKAQAGEAVAQMKHAAGDAVAAGSEMAARASQTVRTSSAEIEAYVERNPWTAVLIAGGIGMMLGLMNRSSK